MTFLFPWAWAWLGAGLGAVFLHLLRRREREHPVSALFLWEPIPPDRVSRVQRVLSRLDLLFLLQLLAVLLLAAGLAGPLFRVGRPAGATAILLDGSASMGSGTRPEEAVEAARRVVRESAGPWAVVLWADPPRLLVPPTDRREEALALLGDYRPTLGSRPPLGPALALLPGGFGRVVVVTDDPPAEEGVEVVLLPPRENLAIVAFSVRPTPGGTGYEALVRVRNDTRRYRDVQVALDTGAGTYLASRLLGPGEEDLFTFSLPLVRPGLRAELLPRDDFPWDNVRYFALEGATAFRVRWLGEEDRYLGAALGAALAVERTAAGPWDLTVAVRTGLPDLPTGPVLLVGASSPEAPLGEAVPGGPFRGADSPLLRHVVPEALRAGAVFPPSLPPGAVVDLWAGDVPVLARWEAPAGRRALLALDLLRSNLPLLPDFPILLRGLLTWLLPFRPRAALVVGEALELPPGTEVLTPQGPVAGVWVPDRPGLYELRGERTEVVAVNVPYGESLPPRPGGGGTARGVAAVAEVPGWPLFALGAFLLLGLEWGLARRRGL